MKIDVATFAKVEVDARPDVFAAKRLRLDGATIENLGAFLPGPSPIARLQRLIASPFN
jgi:hypothetical protein|tara:strand:+ start:182 stop:355 length:174 start_codon:yes stop_codon:yes gene_type:complete